MGFVDWKLLPKLETKLGGIGLWAWLIGGGSSFVLICDVANPQVAVHWPLPCNICYEFMFCLVSIKVPIFWFFDATKKQCSALFQSLHFEPRSPHIWNKYIISIHNNIWNSPHISGIRKLVQLLFYQKCQQSVFWFHSNVSCGKMGYWCVSMMSSCFNLNVKHWHLNFIRVLSKALSRSWKSVPRLPAGNSPLPIKSCTVYSTLQDIHCASCCIPCVQGKGVVGVWKGTLLPLSSWGGFH